MIVALDADRRPPVVITRLFERGLGRCCIQSPSAQADTKAVAGFAVRASIRGRARGIDKSSFSLLSVGDLPGVLGG